MSLQIHISLLRFLQCFKHIEKKSCAGIFVIGQIKISVGEFEIRPDQIRIAFFSNMGPQLGDSELYFSKHQVVVIVFVLFLIKQQFTLPKGVKLK